MEKELTRAEKYRDRAWRKRVNAAIPRLAERIFALRRKSYPGCGFHYSLEKRLGHLLSDLNTHEYNTRLRSWQIELEIMCETLHQDVAIAEIASRKE